MWRYLEIVGDERMVTVDLPRGIVFYTVFAAYILMFLRSVQNFVKDMTSKKTVREQADEAINTQGI
jgi:TRAP-type C4-dicarboxylate transport system permease small subunit